jgi:hypothetical protein
MELPHCSFSWLLFDFASILPTVNGGEKTFAKLEVAM